MSVGLIAITCNIIPVVAHCVINNNYVHDYYDKNGLGGLGYGF